MKPLLLIDVDGVINIFTSTTPHVEWEHEFLHVNEGVSGGTDWIRIPLGMSARFAKLAEHYELIWATGWLDRAHNCFAPKLGLEQWDHIDVSSGFIHASWSRDAGERNAQALSWKLEPVSEWIEQNAQGRHVAWIDDDLYADAFAWAEERDRNHAPTLLMKTDCPVGLLDHHVDKLVMWAEER
jgi:hypothetical protein